MRCFVILLYLSSRLSFQVLASCSLWRLGGVLTLQEQCIDNHMNPDNDKGEYLLTFNWSMDKVLLKKKYEDIILPINSPFANPSNFDNIFFDNSDVNYLSIVASHGFLRNSWRQPLSIDNMVGDGVLITMGFDNITRNSTENYLHTLCTIASSFNLALDIDSVRYKLHGSAQFTRVNALQQSHINGLQYFSPSKDIQSMDIFAVALKDFMQSDSSELPETLKVLELLLDSIASSPYLFQSIVIQKVRKCDPETFGCFDLMHMSAISAIALLSDQALHRRITKEIRVSNQLKGEVDERKEGLSTDIETYPKVLTFRRIRDSREMRFQVETIIANIHRTKSAFISITDTLGGFFDPLLHTYQLCVCRMDANSLISWDVQSSTWSDCCDDGPRDMNMVDDPLFQFGIQKCHTSKIEFQGTSSSTYMYSAPHNCFDRLLTTFRIAPLTVLQMRFISVKRFLSASLHPPDASRGAEMFPMLISEDWSEMGSSGDMKSTYLPSFSQRGPSLEPSLILLPICDFSMSFNVITLFSTTFAFLLGCTINNLVRSAH